MLRGSADARRHGLINPMYSVLRTYDRRLLPGSWQPHAALQTTPYKTPPCGLRIIASSHAGRALRLSDRVRTEWARPGWGGEGGGGGGGY